MNDEVREFPLVSLASMTRESSDRVGTGLDVPVLSSTKHYGLVKSDEYFKGRQIFSDNISNYKSVVRDEIAYATNHLSEGSIGLQSDYDIAAVSPIYTVFSCHPDRVLPAYLIRVLKSRTLLDAYARHEQASVDRRGAVRYRDFSAIQIPLPSMNDQRRITQILDTLDDQIKLQERYIGKLEAVKQGIIDDIVTPLRGSARHPTRVVRLEDVADVQRGKFGHRPRNDPRYLTGPYPFIQTGDVAAADGGVIGATTQSLSSRGAAVSKEFPAGTIAVTIAANIADTAILGRPMYFPDSVVGVTVHPPHEIRFIELIIRASKKHLESRAPQSAQKNINLQDLRPLSVPLPEPDSQRKIAAVYVGAAAAVQCERLALEKLKILRLALLSDLVTGRVRVPAEAAS